MNTVRVSDNWFDLGFLLEPFLLLYPSGRYFSRGQKTRLLEAGARSLGHPE